MGFTLDPALINWPQTVAFGALLVFLAAVYDSIIVRAKLFKLRREMEFQGVCIRASQIGLSDRIAALEARPKGLCEDEGTDMWECIRGTEDALEAFHAELVQIRAALPAPRQPGKKKK